MSRIKTVVLISGGLDSALAAKILIDLGVDVFGIHFVLPWGCGDKPRSVNIAEQLKIPLKIIQLDEDFLDIVKKPQHGYGSAINPCVDCRIYNLKKAKKYMEEIGADFVATGEILGQRPMSQMRRSLKSVEIGSGLENRLLRPLCAKLLDPTDAEKQGKIDREKLHNFSGRSRSGLQKMGENLDIKNYTPTGGGCLLTDRNFARRIKDSFKHGYKNLDEIISLRWGRHFRINEHFKVIVGRDEFENKKLIEHAENDDFIFELKDFEGPTAILKGKNPKNKEFLIAANLVRRYSKYRTNANLVLSFWNSCEPNNIQEVQSTEISEEILSKLFI
ncbi:MAG: hypothetical protein PHY73_03140 [Candidatus Omnitrophica bacterium]|nr:hypothetical protein [Candidatus Omnitrophota bacterium]